MATIPSPIPVNLMPLTPPPVPADLLNSTPPPIPEEWMPPIKMWYLAREDGSFALIPEDELIANGFDEDSYVWSEETGWEKGENSSELNYLLGEPFVSCDQYEF